MRSAFGIDCGLDLDWKSFLQTGFLTGSEGKIGIGLESKILDWILDFFQPLMTAWLRDPSSPLTGHGGRGSSRNLAYLFYDMFVLQAESTYHPQSAFASVRHQFIFLPATRASLLNAHE